MSDYEVIKIDEKSKGDFILAWESAFDRSLSSEVYDWVFNENNIKYALVDDNEIVAGYCLYAHKCILGNAKGVALLCNNVFVCPGHQGKHLFVKIGKAALNDVSKYSNALVAYGIPNALALPGHKRVGWGVQDPIRFLKKTPKTDKKLGLKSSANEWQYGVLEKNKRQGLSNCSKKASEGREFSIIKDEKFIQWRYENKPLVDYWFGISESDGVVEAYCICKFYEEKKALHIIDIDGVDNESIRSLISDLDVIPENFDFMNVWSTTAHKDLFLLEGFSLSSETDNFIAIEVKSLSPVFFSDNFNLCLGDNDVY